MQTDFSIIKDIAPLFQCKIIIYGTGTFGRTMLKELYSVGINVMAFGDSFAQRKQMDGLPVYAPEEIKKFCEEESILIVLASDYYAEIYQDLLRREIQAQGIVTAFAVRFAIFLNCRSNWFDCEHQKELLCRIDLWKKIRLEREEKDRALINFIKLMQIQDEKDILIYQPGKVGSSSIRESLLQCGFFCDHILNIHMLNNRMLKQKEGYQDMLKWLKRKQIKIITSVRDPIARGISSFFQPFDAYKVLLYDGMSNDLCNSCVRYLKEYCCNDNLPSKGMPMFALNEYTSVIDHMGNEFAWFDKELKEVFGIDVFEYPFDKEKGYSIIERGGISVFVYKLEKLNDLETELGSFIERENFHLVRANDGNKKMSRFLYHEVKKSIRIPEECLNYFYKNNFKCEHFYSPEEINEFEKKWMR